MTTAPEGAASRSAGEERRAPDARAYAVVFLLAFGLSLTWAAATPMFGVPDEISHMVRAAGAARGDISGRPVGDGTRMYDAPLVLVPGSKITGTPSELCYAFNSGQSADCMVLSSDRSEGSLVSTASSYPPVYYLLVGWPSRVLDGSRGLYGMRAASSGLFAALFALATISLRKASAGPMAYAGLALAATPMAWFVGGSVSPSSLAIGAGLAAWCGGLLLFTDAGAGHPISTSAWRFGLPLSLLLLVRRDSLLWGGLIVVSMALLTNRQRVIDLLRSRDAIGWGLVAAACAISASRTGIEQGSRVLLGGGSPGSASAAFGALPYYLNQMVGVLGWLDTFLPSLAYLLWFFAFGALFLGCLAFGPVRIAGVAGFVAVVLVGAIVAIGSQRFPYFQSRYALPFAVGAPLLAAIGLTHTRLGSPRRPVVILLTVAVVVHGLAFYQQYRRYAISGDTTWWVFENARWQPDPAPFALLLVLHIVLLLAVHLGLFLAPRRQP